jgi:late competence protein required for DNA uptake (superfamily II DNA/RNA helicase)
MNLGIVIQLGEVRHIVVPRRFEYDLLASGPFRLSNQIKQKLNEGKLTKLKQKHEIESSRSKGRLAECEGEFDAVRVLHLF